MTIPHSFWLDSLEPSDGLHARAPLTADIKVDIAIVGAGYAGLWAAYYLLKGDPSLDLAVIESQTAGFGASGRNGGWCVPETGASFDALDQEGGAGTGARMMRAMHRTVDVIGQVAQEEGIDCGFAKGGAIWFASDGAQLDRLHARMNILERHGLTDAYRMLSPAETTAKVNATGIHGSIYTPNAAAVHPARLARGIARAVEKMGGVIFENTPATRLDGRKVVTPNGTVTAEIVVRATEGYTANLKGHRRNLAPLGNYMIATDPIAPELWAEMGLNQRELFEDTPAMLAYGQRTMDDRIAWGGLGAYYWWGSRVPRSPMQAPRIAERLRLRLIARFPMLEGIKVSHHWGGIMGITRDLRSTVGLDRSSGRAWSTGFGGAGVVPSNAAGRTLADLVLDRESELTEFGWTNHISRKWEPEPFRWLGINAMLAHRRIIDFFKPTTRGGT